MVKIGKTSTLEIIKFTDQGAYLDGGPYVKDCCQTAMYLLIVPKAMMLMFLFISTLKIV